MYIYYIPSGVTCNCNTGSPVVHVHTKQFSVHARHFFVHTKHFFVADAWCHRPLLFSDLLHRMGLWARCTRWPSSSNLMHRILIYYIYMYIYIYIHIYIYISHSYYTYYIYAHIYYIYYIHTHTHTHTCMYVYTHTAPLTSCLAFYRRHVRRRRSASALRAIYL